jgi:hypothetical protein
LNKSMEDSGIFSFEIQLIKVGILSEI